MNTFYVTAVGLIGFYFTAKKQAFGWLIGIISQLMWVVYALQVHDLQILFPSAVYTGVYIYCFVSWVRKPKLSDLLSRITKENLHGSD